MTETTIPVEERYPRFSREEFDRRRTTVRELMRERHLDALIVYGDSGANRHNQANVHYLANYMDQHHNYLVFFADPGTDSTLFVGLNNHLPNARELSVIDDTRWGTYAPAETVVERIREADTAVERIGIVGVNSRFNLLVPHQHYETFEDGIDAELVDATKPYERIRTVKSEPEIDWLRRGAAYTDSAVEALAEEMEPGMREYELKGLLESAYLREGGQSHISYLSSTPMNDPEPGKPLPWQHASTRRIREGDVVNTELSAAYWGYTGQIHRPFAVGQPPTDEYRDLFDVAVETYENILGVLEPGNTEQDVLRAAAPIGEAGYEIYDVLVHGYGVDLHPPSIGIVDSNYWPIEDEHHMPEGQWEFEENMVIVVQPNVITPDERFGVQVGNTTVIRSDGPEVLTEYPLEFVQI